MKLATTTPQKALKAFKNQRPSRAEIDKFKKNLIGLLDKINLIEGRPKQESEEHLKNDVRDFLRDTYYIDSHAINTKDKKDLVIHLGKNVDTEVGVIIEAKRPSNKNEMVTVDNANKKAFHELVLYYLNERLVHNNHSLKQLVITNINEWYIIDANYFDKNIYQNRKIKAEFDKKLNDNKDNPYFYERIESILAESPLEIDCVYFDFRNINKVLRDNDAENDKELIALYKILSPQHLLKEAKPNDSNSLDTNFYKELLHIIGLEEVKEGSKNIIRRKIDKVQAGSLIESVIFELENIDAFRHIKDPSTYGQTLPERHFNIALELCITWVNRMLFLKLLEGQLKAYHSNNTDYSFLNINKIKDFDVLASLFHKVLAVKINERHVTVKDKFKNVPYLNSSLFERTEIEQDVLAISNIDDSLTLDFYSTTILKDLKKTKANLPTLEYIFEFLEAYDFASEVKDDFQNDKTIISASVLGKVFEKINGYKDGSIYTPAFITMYMCKQSIRLAVLDKFNEALSEPDQKRFDEFGDIKNYFNKNDKKTDIKQGNEIINSLKICDPAVGSGHFLVSALNEIISIKADLGIFADENQQTFGKYEIEIANDELLITDRQGNDLNYKIVNGKPDTEIQRLQKALFHEKETIIENCLFGVDINPNSVKICRLRLWIELLKNSYYKADTDFKELETLPNIDINIKCGNSLLSRFALGADLKQALSKSKWTIDTYKNAVHGYHNVKGKEAKKELEALIETIKTDFKTEIAKNDPKILKKNKLAGELLSLLTQSDLFEDAKQKKIKAEKKLKFEKEIDVLAIEINAIQDNAIYKNAFEWRFEFPEVLNDVGDFLGFDIIIGNPPYIRQEEFADFKLQFQRSYETYNSTADLYVYFVEKGINLLKNNGEFIYILPNKWMKAGYGLDLRKWTENINIRSIVDFGDLPVFESATTYPSLLSINKSEPTEQIRFTEITTLNFEKDLEKYIIETEKIVNKSELNVSGWVMVEDSIQNVIKKIRFDCIHLSEYVKGNIFRGLLTALNEAFIINESTKNQLIAEDPKSVEIIKPFLSGRDIKRYKIPKNDYWLILFPKGFTIKNNLPEPPIFYENSNIVMESPPRYGDMPLNNAWKWIRENYPSIAVHLQPFKEKAESRSDKGDFWWELRACDYYDSFEKKKIVWPETSLDNQFCYVEKGVYLNKTSFFIPIEDDFLLGILNSKLAKFYFSSIVSKMRGGYFSMSKAYVETLPIKQNEDFRFKISNLVDQIITQKQQNQDTYALENEIDKLVYQLYELTDEEIRIVEGEK